MSNKSSMTDKGFKPVAWQKWHFLDWLWKGCSYRKGGSFVGPSLAKGADDQKVDMKVHDRASVVVLVGPGI